MISAHKHELHFSHRNQWLRAAVLGANDGIVSTASLVLGVAAADPDPGHIMLAGVAALVAGALSMAAGEYVSVSSQADTEQADLKRERQELSDNHEFELNELTHIYINTMHSAPTRATNSASVNCIPHDRCRQRWRRR